MLKTNGDEDCISDGGLDAQWDELCRLRRKKRGAENGASRLLTNPVIWRGSFFGA